MHYPRSNKLRLLLPALIALVCGIFYQAYADEPVVFSRDTIYIVPRPDSEPKALPLKEEPKVEVNPDKAADKAEAEKVIDAASPPARRKKEVLVNIRPEIFLQQPGVFNLQPFMDAGGLLIVLTEPRRNALQANNIYASVDVIFIASDGTITQIAPSITPSGLEESINTKDNTFALLFLKDGDSKSKDIRPGDTVQHSLFKAKPVILTQ